MVSVWNRFMSAIAAGYKAFNSDELSPAFESQWGDKSPRLGRYAFLELYRNENPYKYARADAYRYRRNIVNTANQIVEFYVGQVYGGTIDNDLQGGAIPIETDNDALRPALMQLYRDSNWQAEKSLFVRTGATFGDVAVKLVDDRQFQRVNMEVLHPGKIHTLERDSRGWVTYARIEYEERLIDPDTGDSDRTYTYREDITPTEFRTYMDDKPYAYYADAAGNKVDTWKNPYNFVPLDLCQHQDLGLGWGVSAFFFAIPLIDEINEAWSLLNDAQRKNVDIIWGIFANKGASGLTIGRTERDGMPLVYLGPEGKPPFPMVPNVDISGGTGNIERLTQQLYRKQPELGLMELRQSANLTAPGIRAGWSDAIDLVNERRGNYDASLVRLNKIGLIMGSMNRYRGYEGLGGVTDVQDDRIQHEIAQRPVIEDSISQQDRINALNAINNVTNPELARAILEELNLKVDMIDAIIANIQPQQQAGQGMNPAFFDEVGAVFDEIDNGAAADVVAPVDEQQEVEGQAA